MGGIVDFISDVLGDIAGAILDIIHKLVILVHIVEWIIEKIASLLGLDDQIVEQFEVHNQPLFDDPDRSAVQTVIRQSILKNEDIPTNVLYAEIFGGKKNIKRFIRHIDSGEYFEGFPEIQASVQYVDYGDVTNVLNNSNGVPCTIDQAVLGTLFPPNWIKYWLQENKDYSIATNKISHNGLTYSVDVYDSDYNEATDNYSLQFSSPVQETITTVSKVGKHYRMEILEGLFVTNDDAYDSYDAATKEHTIEVTVTTATNPGYVVPTKPINLHYVVNYHKDSSPTDTILFVYKVGEGTYPDLDDPTLSFGDDPSEVLDILPAIPLRIDNVNFNATATTKSEQITKAVDILGFDAADLIDAVLQDVADAGVDDYLNKVDHVYLNFGVRLWDTSQIAMNYLFRFCGMLHTNQAVTEGIYNTSPVDDRTYNNIIITAADYKSVFKFAYIKYAHYTLAEINADASSDINAMYYSDLSMFDDANELMRTYYVSSGKPGYNVGYRADTLLDVNAFLGGTLAQLTGYTTEAANWLQVSERIGYTATILEADGATSSDKFLFPSLSYENDAGTIKLVDIIAEETTKSQAFSYFQCVPNGMNVYTLHSPIGALRVVDAATTKFKLVKFNLANKNDIMVPFSYDLVSHLPNKHISSLFVASAHISLYVAHYEVIVVPFWAKLLAVVLIVIAIYLLYVSWGTSSSLSNFLIAAAYSFVEYYIMKEIILAIASEFSPELAMILVLILSIYFYNPDASFEAMAQLFGTTADLISSVVTQENEYEMSAINEEQASALKKVENSMEAMRDAYPDLLRSASGDALSLLNVSTRGNINPMFPEVYLQYHSSLYDIAQVQLDAGSLYETTYDYTVMSV